MADEPKPKIDMKEEGRKIAEAKASDDKIVNKEKKVEQKSDKQPAKDAQDVKSSIIDKKITEPSGKAKEETKPEEKKKPIQKKPVVKKTEAIVNAVNLPISTKYTAAVCRFIKNKKIENAISDLEQVLIFKKPVPMKGEIPHRKGKRMMSGRYPKKTTEQFIKLLKNLLANASANGLENPIIVEAVANIASRPFGRFGKIRKKRTHVRIKCVEKKLIGKNKK